MKQYEKVAIKKFVLGLLVLLIILTLLKCFLNSIADKGAGDLGASRSIYAAKKRGVFIVPIDITPKTIRINEMRNIVIKEAWLERFETVKYKWVWVKSKEKVEGYRICFTLDKRSNEYFFNHKQNLFFSIDETNFKGYGPEYRGTNGSSTIFVINFYQKFETSFKPFTMRLIEKSYSDEETEIEKVSMSLGNAKG